MGSNRRASALLLIYAIALLQDPVQSLRFKRSVDTNQLTEAPNQSDEHDFDNIPDFSTIVQRYNADEKDNQTVLEGGSNWRLDKSFAERLEHMRNISKLTDCSFIVGDDDGKTAKFEAHLVVLAAASPIFEAVFANSTSVRVRGWKPENFEALLNFIYSGEMCFENFEAACTLLYHAKSLKLNGVTEVARGYIYEYMYPDNLWRAYHCAKNAADQDLLESAKELISDHTSQTFKDRAFNDLSQDDLANLLSRDDLNVKSEVEVFEAVTRWGLMRVVKEGKTPSPELIREKIGPAVLKHIRFLTMTGVEFSRVHTSTQLLTYEEGLAILLNINNPGVLEMPKSLCPLTEKRKHGNKRTVFKTLGGSGMKPSCGKNSLHQQRDIFDLYTTTAIPNNVNEGWNIIGIQIPKSIEAKNNCAVNEQFDVIILDSENKIVEKFAYNAAPPCKTRRFISNTGNYYNMGLLEDENLVDVVFDKKVYVPPQPISKRYKIKVVIKGKKSYPHYVNAGDFMQEEKRGSNVEQMLYQNYFTFSTIQSRYRLLYNPNFVYAILTV